MNVSFIATLTEEPEIRYVGKNKTPLVELKVAEDRGKYGINNFEVNVWGDLAVEAQLLSVGDVLDFTPYYDDKENLRDRKSTRLNSSHVANSYAVVCLTKKTQ